MYCVLLAKNLGGGYREYLSMTLDEMFDLIETVGRVNEIIRKEAEDG